MQTNEKRQKAHFFHSTTPQAPTILLYLPQIFKHEHYIILNMKDFKTLCETRFSTRKFTEQPVSDDDLSYILECARLAPSAVNRQPWRFLIVKSKENLEKLRQCYSREWFRTAPLCIVALKDTTQAWVRPEDQKPHDDIDLSIAIEHICLAAAERGLGSCWVCNYDPTLFVQLFPQQPGIEAVALIPIGHIAPDCPQKEKSRKSLEDITETI